LALLRVGFAKPNPSPESLVRSYRTVSPLPPQHVLRHDCGGGLFSVALSCESPRLAVSQHPALWSPDLPQSLRSAITWSPSSDYSRDTGLAGDPPVG